MLESLGYAEAPAREEADLILFNTCSIREKADSRFVAHLGEAKRLKREDPDRVVGVGGCWAQSVKDEVFAPLPVGRRRLRARPGPPARRVPHLRLAHRAGLLRVRGLHRPPAGAARAREFQAWVQISVGCNCRCSYCIVPSTRGREVSRPVRRARGRGRAAGRRRRARGDAARAERELLRARPAGRERATFAGLLHALDAIDGHRPHPLHEPAPEGHARGRHPRPRRARAVCEHIHLPLQSGSTRVLKAMRRTYDRERYLDRVALIREHVPGLRALHRHHRRVPGGDRGGLLRWRCRGRAG